MSFFNMVMQSKYLSNSCKRYYKYLVNLTKTSKSKNWKITSGKYENYNFIIPTDTVVASPEKLNMGLTSIYRYKKTLQSLGLIDILKKCTTRTNQRRNYHNRQLTVVLKTVPRKLIGMSLVFRSNIKNAKILKTYDSIITQVNRKLNTAITNIHVKIKKLLNNVKTTNYTNNTSYNNLKNLNKNDVQAVTNTLNTYKIEFKDYQIKDYIKLYKKSKEKFIQTCRYCSDKRESIYAPLKYFTKVFESSKTYINKFWNFPQREYDFDELEKMIIHNLN